MRRSSRLASPAEPAGQTTTGHPESDSHEPSSKRPRRRAAAVAAAASADASAPTTAAPALKGKSKATAAAAAAAASVTKAEGEEVPTLEGGPSAYELERLEKMRRNALVLASLGLSSAKGEMRTAVKSEAARRARSRGLPPRQPKAYPARTRESARVRGKTPEGLPMEDPEEAFGRKQAGHGFQAMEAEVERMPSRFSGDVSMAASNASDDGTLRLRQMLGGLVGRHETGGGGEEYELAEPDDVLQRLRGLKVKETGVCKVVRERAYSLAWHPSEAKLLVAVGDKAGNVGLWTVDGGDGDDDGGGVFQFKPHTRSVPRLAFDPFDGNKLISTSYDGTVRRMDVEKGAFEQVFAKNASDDSAFTDGHLMAEERTLLLSDGIGDITAVDLRTNTQVWKREAHEKKVNTVHTHPTTRSLFITASLDRSVRLWDARNLGPGSGAGGIGGMKSVAELPHFRSVNSAHFSPGGEWVASVGQDDKIRLYQELSKASGPQVLATHVLPHNNQTGRWLTKFQASWDPKSKGLFAIGSMQKGPHAVHLYSVAEGAKKPSAVEVTGDDVMTSIQSVVVFHPSRDVLAGVNSSGRAHIFT